MWLYEWEPHKVSQYPGKFSGHRHCDSGDIMALVCHMTSQDHVIEVSSDFMGRSPGRWDTFLPKLVTIDTVVVEI